MLANLVMLQGPHQHLCLVSLNLSGSGKEELSSMIVQRKRSAAVKDKEDGCCSPVPVRRWEW
ncbi:hypothetical protein PAHAL_8G073000 [Panicum hallii]|uniref:Uncharacterized protein n=1 Tax=Panicum hallii TaxID=206008 RepID=A0A2T8I821_9POAL|nr:hypothetical protein PAHAL_8G073000 [Panicum hallii]